MKKVFIIAASAAIVVFIAAFIIGMVSYTKDKGNLQLSLEPGEVLEVRQLNVIQFIGESRALVKYGNGKTALLMGPEGRLYYDGEIIELGENSEFRQVGVFTYYSNNGLRKTVPAIASFQKLPELQISKRNLIEVNEWSQKQIMSHSQNE